MTKPKAKIETKPRRVGALEAEAELQLKTHTVARPSVNWRLSLVRREHLTGTLRAAGRQFSPHLISAPLLAREAISSSRIEGANTTPEQLALLDLEPPGDERARNISETEEVANYIAALNHGFSSTKFLFASDCYKSSTRF